MCVSVFPTVLIANKADLEIGREVTTEEGQRLAKELRFVAAGTVLYLAVPSDLWYEIQYRNDAAMPLRGQAQSRHVGRDESMNESWMKCWICLTWHDMTQRYLLRSPWKLQSTGAPGCFRDLLINKTQEWKVRNQTLTWPQSSLFRWRVTETFTFLSHLVL